MGKHAKRRCVIKTCSFVSYSFHEFPANFRIRQLWLEKIQQYADITLLKELSVICGGHFRSDDYVHGESKRLKRSAVPSVFMDYVPEIEHNYSRHPFENMAVVKRVIPNVEPAVAEDKQSQEKPTESDDLKSLDTKNKQLQQRLIDFTRLKDHIKLVDQENKQLREKLMEYNKLKHSIETLNHENQELKEQLSQATEELEGCRSLVATSDVEFEIFKLLKEDAIQLDSEALSVLDLFYNYKKMRKS